LELDERELALLEALLTIGRSRPLARRCGHDRETLKRWQDSIHLKLRISLKRNASTVAEQLSPPH
jgi:hypothetical protein